MKIPYMALAYNFILSFIHIVQVSISVLFTHERVQFPGSAFRQQKVDSGEEPLAIMRRPRCSMRRKRPRERNDGMATARRRVAETEPRTRMKMGVPESMQHRVQLKIRRARARRAKPATSWSPNAISVSWERNEESVAL